MNIDEIKQKIQEQVDDLKNRSLDFVDQVREKLPEKFGGLPEGSLEDELTGDIDGEEYYDEDEEYEDSEDVTGEVDFTGSQYGMSGSIDPIEAVRRARNTSLGITDPAVEDDEEYEDEDDEEELDPEAAEKAAQRSKIIRYVAFFGLIWYAMDFVFEEEPPKPKNNPAKKVGKKNNKKNKQENKEPVAQKDMKEQPQVPKKKQEEVKPITAEPVPVTPEPEDNKAGEMKIDPKVTNEPVEYIEDPNEEMKEIGFGKGRKDGQIINNKVPTKIKEINISDDLSKILNETQKQVEKTVEYVAPPDYTKYGRGLVYNCRQKHWACVDRSRWFNCKGNLKYTEFYGKEKECFPVNVYSSQRDCRVIQLHNINTNADISFCK